MYSYIQHAAIDGMLNVAVHVYTEAVVGYKNKGTLMLDYRYMQYM